MGFGVEFVRGNVEHIARYRLYFRGAAMLTLNRCPSHSDVKGAPQKGRRGLRKVSVLAENCPAGPSAAGAGARIQAWGDVLK